MLLSLWRSWKRPVMSLSRPVNRRPVAMATPRVGSNCFPHHTGEGGGGGGNADIWFYMWWIVCVYLGMCSRAHRLSDIQRQTTEMIDWWYERGRRSDHTVKKSVFIRGTVCLLCVWLKLLPRYSSSHGVFLVYCWKDEMTLLVEVSLSGWRRTIFFHVVHEG